MNISQVEIDSMEFWEYSNMVIYLTRIIEEENKRNGSNDIKGDHSKMMKSSQSQMSRNMSSAKASLPKVK
jgi:hypothetical protein